MNDQLKSSIKEIFMDISGPLLSGEDLWKGLGYMTQASFHQSMYRNTVPVPLINIPGQKQHYCLLHDVVDWLVDQRSQSEMNMDFNEGLLDKIPYASKKLFLMEQGMLIHEKFALNNMKHYPNADELVKNIAWFRLDGRGKKQYALSYEAIPLFMNPAWSPNGDGRRL